MGDVWLPFLSKLDGKNGLNIGRVDVSEPASISAGIASRYARALFDLAKETKKLKALETDVSILGELLSSDDFTAMINSPLVSRDAQETAVAAIAKKAKLSALTGNTLGLMAQKGRLFVVPAVANELAALIAEEKGEVTAEVTAAKALTKAQSDKLAKTLKATVGKDVKINTTVDESIIGGLIVKVGSKMIDTSISSKLNALQNSMKEVG